MSVSRIYNQATSVATLYSSALKAPTGSCLGFDILHPASTSTTYSVEGSNAGDLELATTGNWFAYTAVDPIAEKTSAERFGIRLTKFPFRAARIKMITSAGTGTIVIDGSAKAG